MPNKPCIIGVYYFADLSLKFKFPHKKIGIMFEFYVARFILTNLFTIVYKR
jgi:hypothetical protein